MENLPTLTKATEIAADQSPQQAGLRELGVLLHSAAYAGLQAPVNAVLQSFGDSDGKLAERLPHIDAPEKTTPWSLDWNLQQIGTGIGMILPVLASRKMVTGLVPSATAELAAQKGLAALTAGEAKTLTRYELGVSLGTGLVYGGVLTPSQLEPGQSLLEARLKQATGAALTFGTLSLASNGLKTFADSAAIKENAIGTVLQNNTARMALSGIPAGLLSVDAQSVIDGKGLPSITDHFDSKHVEAIYNFSIVGAGIGRLMGPEGQSEREPIKFGLERSASDSSLAGRSSSDMLLELQSKLSGGEQRIADLDLSAVKAPEKVTYQRDVRELPQLKQGATATGADGAPLSLGAFEANSLNHVTTPVRIYEADGIAAKVIVPEEYAAKLDRLEQLKQTATTTGADASKAATELAKPEMQDLAKHMTVQDAFRHALMTPEPGKFKEIILSDQTNPYDLWYKANTGNADFSSAADTVFSTRQTSWYKQQLAPTLTEDTMHEWSHLFDEHNPLYAQIIRNANQVDNLPTRSYAKVPREQIAILLGEYALHPSGERVNQLLSSAPVTSTAIGEGLSNLLSRIPVEERSPLHEQLLARADMMRNLAAPVARQTLIEQINNNGDSSTAGKNALKALVFLGQPEDFAGLTSVRSVNMSYQPLSDANGALLGHLPDLNSADLRHTFVGVDTMRQLGNAPLENLNLEGTRVTNASMSYLPQTITNLNISGTRLSDQALPFLKRIQTLEKLNISNTKISADGFSQLKAALPNTRIIR